MSLGDPGLLSALYDELASPPLTPNPLTSPCRVPGNTFTSFTPQMIPSTPINSSPVKPTPTQISVVPVIDHPTESHQTNDVPPGSLLPNKILVRPLLTVQPRLTPLCVDTTLKPVDSLTREKKGKMPALSHLLSVGKGRVLSLAADEQYVYAGCQSADNEIVVSHFVSI